MRFKITKKWNIHYNLGIFTNESKEIVGNSQYGYYIFRDNRLLKRKIEEVETIANTNSVDYEIFPAEVRSYGQYCGEVLYTIAQHFGHKISINKTDISNKFSIDLYYKDFNSNKHFSHIYRDSEGKILFLYVLHILTFINSTVKLFKLFESNDNGWWLRVYYITYHYAMRRLVDIKNHFDNNKSNHNGFDILINEILNTGSTILSNSQFRNCMMHYDLYDKNNNFLIAPNYLNPNLTLFGLVESHFNGVTYEQIKLDIIDRLINISDILAKWLNIPFKHLQKL